MNNQLFYQFQCLTEKSRPIPGPYILKTWFKRSDRRYIAEALQKFKAYNQNLFNFLDITPIIEGSGKETTLSFRSGHYVGAIPLRAPDTGKQIGDLVVSPRYTAAKDKFTDYFEIINLTQTEYPPEFKASIPLKTNNNIKPPLYLESAKYIDLLEQGIKSNWNKFVNKPRNYEYPKPNVNWNKYIRKSYNPQNTLVFPSTSNQLSKHHPEFYELKYVYEIAKNELNSDRTPGQIKYYLRDRITRLDQLLQEYETSITNELFIHNSDPTIIKKVKTQGNMILKNNAADVPAWRIDFSLLFEKYVQYIFRQISREIGARQFDNYKIHRASGYNPNWSLNYLEPDVFLDKNNYNIIVDAKYKSHLLNFKSLSESLKETHRADLHQIFAYSAFSVNVNKLCFLCYPNYSVYDTELNYFSNVSEINNKLVLLGIPLSKSEIPKIQKNVRTIITEYESSMNF